MARNGLVGVQHRPNGTLRKLHVEYQRLVLLFERAKYTELATSLKAMLTRNPNFAPAIKLQGAFLVAIKQYDVALPWLRRAVELLPNDAEAAMNLGIACWATADFECAIYQLQRAVKLNPNDLDVRLALAKVHRSRGSLGDAAGELHQVLEQNSGHLGALQELALVSIAAGTFDAARQLLEAVVAIKPGDGDANYALATAYRGLSDRDSAAVAFRHAFAAQPTNHAALLHAIHMELYLCNWRGLSNDLVRLRALLSDEITLAVDPFPFIALPGFSERDFRRIAAAFSAATCAPIQKLPSNGDSQHRVVERLKVAYLSSDFHTHATSELIVGVIEHHDRRLFEVYGYSYGVDDGSDMRGRVVRAFDEFYQVDSLNDYELASKIKQDAIDILVDLKGWTSGTRTQILAYRPAPIQVNWLGFPGTFGSAELADYIVGDKVVTPLSHAGAYAEKIVQMPFSYQPNDDQRKVGAIPTRTQVGLPLNAFVFCSFNQSYKYNPDVADLWAEILRQTENSVLWLLDTGKTARQNLVREFSQRGIVAEQLIFAPKLSASDHLARLSLADVALDTFPCGSHTTAADALWVAVPLITFPGDTFAARVGASLLHAVGLPEFVVASTQEYAALAKKLYSEPNYLSQIKAYLAGDGKHSPLFDTERFTRSLERCYEQMVADTLLRQ